MAPKYTSINVFPNARDDLQVFQARAGGALGKRLNQGDALRLAVEIATAHLSDVRAAAAKLGIAEPPTESIGETQ